MDKKPTNLHNPQAASTATPRTAKLLKWGVMIGMIAITFRRDQFKPLARSDQYKNTDHRNDQLNKDRVES